MSISSNHPINVTPVVLAGSSNLNQWPQSRVLDPIQFQRAPGKPSRFQHTLQCATGLSGCNQSLVLVTSGTLSLALAQIQELQLRQPPRVIVAPIDRGDWFALAAATLVAASDARDIPLIIMDAKTPPLTEQNFTSVVNETVTQTDKHPLVALAQPVAGTNPGNTVIVERTGRTQNHPLVYASANAPKQNRGLRRETVRYSIGHGLIGKPDALIDLVRAKGAKDFETCNLALNQSQSVGGRIWLDLNLWSTLPHKQLDRELGRSTDTLVFRPSDLIAMASSDQPDANNAVISANNTNCEVQSDGHLVAVAGCSDLQIIATRDATLIKSVHCHDAVDTILEQMRTTDRSELFRFDQKSEIWGRETIIDQRADYAIARLDVEPGAAIASHFHVHRVENWQVLAGRGEAQINGKTRNISVGEILEIPQHTIHECRNIGEEMLVILETRRGSFLTDIDRIATSMTGREMRRAS